MGVPVSSLMVMAMTQYIEQKNTLEFAKSGLPDFIEKIEKMKKELDKQKKSVQ